MDPAGLTEMSGQGRRLFGGGLALLPLAVQDPQRVELEFGAVLVTEPVGPLGQVDPEQFDIGRATGLIPHGVDLERDPAEAEGPVELDGQGDHLDVHFRVFHPERLQPELVVLAVAPGLGPLVAEGRRGVPGLEREPRSVLDEGPGHRGRPLRAQGHVAVALVPELVHLLGDDFAALPDAPEEDPDVLEHWVDDQAVAGPAGRGGEGGQQLFPPGRGGRKHVERARRRLEPRR